MAISRPAVHCLVLIDPSRLDSPTPTPGALSAHQPAPECESCDPISRGYHGPDPLKGHGPHATPSNSLLSQAKQSAPLTERHWIESDPRPPLIPHARVTPEAG